MVEFLLHGDNISLFVVAASVGTVNADECLMTRMQEMSLDYHFKVEQEVGSSAYAFFGFNGNKLLISQYMNVTIYICEASVFPFDQL